MRAVNLIPAEQRAGAGGMTGRSDGAAYMVLGVLAGIVIMALLYGSASHQIGNKRKEIASLTGQVQNVETEANQLSSYTSFIALHDERVQDISNLINTRFDWPHVFHELGRVLPTDVSLSSVQGSIGAATASSASATTPDPTATTTATSSSVASATPPGSVPILNLSGCTVSQSEVAVTLARLRLIDGVTEVHLNSSSKSGSTGGSCGENTPSFTVQVTFTALPAPTASGSAAPSGAASTAGTPTSTVAPGA